MSHYAAGAAFERKVRDKLLQDGAKLVVRSAGSKGPVDLVALYEADHRAFYDESEGAVPEVDAIQVKRGRGMTKAKQAELCELAESVGARAVLAYPEKVGRRVEVRLEVL